MKISIAQRYRPFSHTPGHYYILPHSSLRMQIFPALLRIEDVSSGHPLFLKEVPLDIQGPVKHFTVMQDLERGCLQVWGEAITGFFRYHIVSKNDNFEIVEKNHKDHSKPVQERLFLGITKSQDWDLMHRRLLMAELLPIWHRLGLMIPSKQLHFDQGTMALLAECEQLVRNREKMALIPKLEALFLSGFDGCFSPRLYDHQHQGIIASSPEIIVPLELLAQASRFIRSLFIQENENQVEILPMVPPEFHCGRFINIELASCSIDLEWSKKTIRRVAIRSRDDQEILFKFPKNVESYRLRQRKEEKGKRVSNGGILALARGQEYYLDQYV